MAAFRPRWGGLPPEAGAYVDEALAKRARAWAKEPEKGQRPCMIRKPSGRLERGRANFPVFAPKPSQTLAGRSGTRMSLGLDGARPAGFAPVKLGCDIPAHIACPRVPGFGQGRQLAAIGVLAGYAGTPGSAIRTGKKATDQWRQEDGSGGPATEYDCK
jgi:hypothetical protein